MSTHPRVDVETTLKSVTVYRDRAQLGYAASVRVGAGVHTLVMRGQSEWTEMDRDTVQMRLEDAQTTPAVLRNVGFVSRAVTEDTRERVVKLRAQRDEVEAKLNDVADRIEVSEEAGKFADRVGELLKAVGSTDKRLVVEEVGPLQQYLQDPSKWSAMAAFISRTRRESRETVIELSEEQSSLQEEVDRLNNELREAGDYGGAIARSRAFVRTRTENTLEATVEVQAGEGESVELRLLVTFVVMGAQWTPLYDLRVNADESTMEVGYYAQVSQRTGMDWSKVRLRLSTAAPHFGGSPPSLGGRWDISLNPPVVHLRMGGAPCGMRMKKSLAMNYSAVPRAAPMVEEAAVGGAASSSSATTFTIPGLVSVRCDNKPVKVTVARRTFPVVLSYTAVPKADPLTYLTAKATNETDYELLPGKTNVFMDNTFVNNGRLELVQSGAEFTVSLGADDAVKVTRKRVQRMESEAKSIFTGAKKRIDYVYAFEVACSQNRKPVEVVVRDQYPISEDKDLPVTLVEPSEEEVRRDAAQGAKTSVSVDDQNQVEWKLMMDPREKRHFRFAFRAEYPVDKEMYGLED